MAAPARRDRGDSDWRRQVAVSQLRLNHNSGSSSSAACMWAVGAPHTHAEGHRRGGGQEVPQHMQQEDKQKIL